MNAIGVKNSGGVFLCRHLKTWSRQTPQESDSWTCQMDIKEEARIRAGMSGYQKVHGVNAGSGLGGKSSGVCPLRTRLLCPSGEPISVEQQDKLMARNRVTYLEKVQEK